MSDQIDLHNNLPYFEETEPEYEKLTLNIDLEDRSIKNVDWEKLMDWATD